MISSLVTLLLAVKIGLASCDFALVRQETRLQLISSDTTSTFDIVREGQVVDIQFLEQDCSVTTFKQKSCNLLSGNMFYLFDSYQNDTFSNTSIGDATVLLSDGRPNEIAVCSRIALRTLCPTFASTEYKGSNNVYEIEDDSESIAQFPTTGSDSNPPWCVGICVNDVKQKLCFKFGTLNLENCIYGNDWMHIAPSTDQQSGDGVTCLNDASCSTACNIAWSAATKMTIVAAVLLPILV